MVAVRRLPIPRMRLYAPRRVVDGLCDMNSAIVYNWQHTTLVLCPTPIPSLPTVQVSDGETVRDPIHRAPGITRSCQRAYSFAFRSRVFALCSLQCKANSSQLSAEQACSRLGVELYSHETATRDSLYRTLPDFLRNSEFNLIDAKSKAASTFRGRNRTQSHDDIIAS